MTRIFALLVLITFLFACSDPCRNVNCGDFGACDGFEGFCECAQFYEGEQCDIKSRTKFLGTWSSVANNCVDFDDNPLRAQWIITERDTLTTINVQTSGLFGQDVVFNGEILNDSTASINSLIIDSVNVSGSINLSSVNSAKITLTTNVSCDFSLSK